MISRSPCDERQALIIEIPLMTEDWRLMTDGDVGHWSRTMIQQLEKLHARAHVIAEGAEHR